MDVNTAGTSLTNHIPNNTTMEQWGTEEAVIAQADVPAATVAVVGWLSGSAGSNAAGATTDRGEYRLEVSFDGGSTWATLGDSGTIVTVTNTSAGVRQPVSAVGRTTGTVTGDLMLRAMCRDVDGANDMLFADGQIALIVHPT